MGVHLIGIWVLLTSFDRSSGSDDLHTKDVRTTCKLPADRAHTDDSASLPAEFTPKAEVPLVANLTAYRRVEALLQHDHHAHAVLRNWNGREAAHVGDREVTLEDALRDEAVKTSGDYLEPFQS